MACMAGSARARFSGGNFTVPMINNIDPPFKPEAESH